MIKQLKETWKIFWANKKIACLAVFLDVLFFYFVITIHMKILTKLYDSIDIVTSLIQEKMSALGAEKAQSIGMELLNDTQFSYHYNLILKNIGFFILAAIGLFVLFKGTQWFIANRLFVKVKLKDFALRFIPLTLFWAGASAFIVFLMIYLTSKVRFSVFTILSDKAIGNIVGLLFLILVYFAVISYSLVSERKVLKRTWYTGVRNWKKLVPVYIVNLIIAIIPFILAVFLMSTNPFIALAIFVLIVFPALHFTRLFILKNVKLLK